MFSFTVSKTIQWARLESSPGQFWPLSLTFDTPYHKGIFHENMQLGDAEHFDRHAQECTRIRRTNYKRIDEKE